MVYDRTPNSRTICKVAGALFSDIIWFGIIYSPGGGFYVFGGLKDEKFLISIMEMIWLALLVQLC